jgi:hypothetical protein
MCEISPATVCPFATRVPKTSTTDIVSDAVTTEGAFGVIDVRASHAH